MVKYIATILLSLILTSPLALACDTVPVDHNKKEGGPCMVEGLLRIENGQIFTEGLQAACHVDVQARGRALRLYRQWRSQTIVLEVPQVENVNVIEMQYMWGAPFAAFRYRIINNSYEYLNAKPKAHLWHVKDVNI